MRISAILFALPAALLRKTRRTKRRSDCDKFSEDSNDSDKSATDLVLITGCLSKSAECRVFVVPKRDDGVDGNVDEDHEVFCELKEDLNEKSELLKKINDVWGEGKKNNRSRKLRKQ